MGEDKRRHRHKHRRGFWPVKGEFVTEGFMLALPLAFGGQSAPPPAGETAINCLALDPAGSVYLGTAGRKAHVLVAMLRGDGGAVFDMDPPAGAERIDALTVHGEHVYAIASGPAGCGLWRWPRMARGFLIQEWTVMRTPAEKVADLFADRRVADAAADPGGRTLIGVTEPAGELFRLDLESPRPEIVTRVDDEGRFSRRIAMDRTGRVWGTRGRARLWRWAPPGDRIEEVADVPAAAGRAQHTQASAWAVDPVTGAIYGGTTPDGFLFRLDPESGEVIGLGKPSRPDEINALTVGRDGRVFGVCGGDDDIAHLFAYDADRGALTDLGVPVSALAARQYGYVFRCALTGPDGEIYLGQHERVNHLWVYFPPIPPRRP